MSNVIQFLESLGGRSAPSAAEYTASVALLEVDDAQRQALLRGDHATINQLLDGRTKMYCFVATPDSEPESTPDDNDDDGDGVPDQDEPPHERQ